MQSPRISIEHVHSLLARVQPDNSTFLRETIRDLAVVNPRLATLIKMLADMAENRKWEKGKPTPLELSTMIYETAGMIIGVINIANGKIPRIFTKAKVDDVDIGISASAEINAKVLTSELIMRHRLNRGKKI